MLTKVSIRALALVLAGSLLFISGCDSLNLDPKDELPSDAVFKDPALARSYLADIYASTGSLHGSPKMAATTDESVFTHGWGVNQLRLSNLTPGSKGGVLDPEQGRFPGRGSWMRFRWGADYSAIRDINLFLERIQESEAVSVSLKETLIGEAYFLRAFFHASLLRMYGGVPLVNETFDLEAESFEVPRGSFEETVEFVVQDLDQAANRLSIESRRPGAANKGAALALKSRVLLHAASDLFAAGKTPFGGTEAEEYVAYQGGSQQARWERARDAAQAVMDLEAYTLEQTDTPREYHELFTKNNPNSGTIWARHFKEESGAPDIALWLSPNGYNSWTGDSPTQEHVDAYEMADGSQFEWEGDDPVNADEPVDAENPYENRDPRFYANIHYNGAEWRPRPSGLQETDPRGVYQSGFYEVEGQEDLRPGLDTRSGPIQPWNGTKTRYNLKKFVDRSIEPANENSFNSVAFYRYAEILLNYAEASAELGNTQDALQALNKVRNRVGMPDVPANGGPNRTLMERIRHERRIELAFEGLRFFDLRRWMTAPEVMSEDVNKIRIEGHLVDENHPDAQLLAENYYDYYYNVSIVERRQWNTRAYFAPISSDEMTRNPSLVQNPGY